MNSSRKERTASSLDGEMAPRRGRPISFDRGEALSQAAMAFWRLGYEGTSVRELAEAMSITPQSLYAAFRSKEELYRSALEYYSVSLAGFMTEALLSEPSVVLAFVRLYREAAREFSRRDRPLGCMISSGALAVGFENFAPAAQTSAFRTRLKLEMEEKIASGVANGELIEATPIAALARFLAASLQGMSVQAKDGATENELLEIVPFIETEISKYQNAA